MKEFSEYTGQLWKYRVGWILFALHGLAFLAFISFWNGNPAKLALGSTSVFYFATAAVWAGWWLAAIRCPSCGKSPIWYRVSHPPKAGSDIRLLKSLDCPWCGFSPERSPRHDQQSTPARMSRVRVFGSCAAFLVFIELVAYFNFRGLVPKGMTGWLLILLLGPPALLVVTAVIDVVGGKVFGRVDKLSSKRFSWLRIVALLILLSLLILGPAVWSVLRGP